MKKYKHFYNIDPTNFYTLPEEEQVVRIAAFNQFLTSIPSGISIRLTREPLKVNLLGSKEMETTVLTIQISSMEPLTTLLSSAHYSFQELEGSKNMNILREEKDHLITDDGYCACTVLTELPEYLPWTWIHSVFGYINEVNEHIVKEIVLYIDPIDRSKSMKMMHKKKSLLLSQKDKSHKAGKEFGFVMQAYDSLLDGNTKHFSLGVTATVHGKDKAVLKANMSLFNKENRGRFTEFAHIPLLQGKIYFGEYTQPRVADLSFFAILYPFVSGELIETPNGVFLGINRETDGPILYDIGTRFNGNVAIIGTSGSGKSFTAKMFVKRLLGRFDSDLEDDKDRPAVFIADPMNEYYSHRDYYGLDGILVTGEEQLGLDPFKLLRRRDAISMLIGILKVGNTPVGNDLASKTDDSINSIEDLHAKVGKDAKLSLAPFISGPFGQIMKGKPKMSDNIIISLRGATPQSLNDQISLLLILSYIWKRINELPREQLKIVIVDEAWMIMEMPGASERINQFVRMGRKLNLKFVFISQKVTDISEDHGAEGRIIDNIATKIIMRVDPSNMEKDQQVLGLTDIEKERILDFDIGQGIIMTEKHRVFASFYATPEETAKYFNSEAETAVDTSSAD